MHKTFSILIIFLLYATLFSDEKKIIYSQPVLKLEKAPPTIKHDSPFCPARKGRFSPPPQQNSLCVDSARNGYGMANSVPKSLDAVFALTGTDWTGAAYCKYVPGDPNTGIISVLGYHIAAGLHPSSFYFEDYINNIPNSSPGGIFPSFQAAPESPIPIWTEIQLPGDASAYYTLNTNGWEDYTGGWLPPISWLQNTNPAVISSVWMGSTDYLKESDGTYYLGGVWKVGLNTGGYTFLYGKGTTLANLNFNSGIINWPDSLYQMNPPHFAYGSGGFGAWVSTGYMVGDTSQNYRLLICKTFDYGATWGPVEYIDWNSLGIPTSISAGDSIWIPDPQGNPMLYVGAAYIGITYDFDFIITPNNDLHIGCTIAWGVPAGSNSYYPHPRFMGIYDLHSSDMGQTWTSTRIWINSGLNSGDSLGYLVTTNEIDLGYDDAGNIYAAWVDRDPVNVVLSPYPRIDPGISQEYNLDVWASISFNGGWEWSSQPLRITNDPQHCAYGLRLSTRTPWYPQENGKTFIMYQIADLSRPTVLPPELLADHVQWYYFAEAKGFPPPGSIADPTADKGSLPRRPVLLQNYPNPFNPVTTIEFTLPSAQKVNLIVYDVMGRAIANLVDSRLPAGHHQVQWNGREHASGIYWYKLTVGKFSTTRKMLLVK